LYQQIADDIERLILEGTYQPGTRLPGEHELAEQYEVSRNVIREALKRLKEHGLVMIRTGSGAYVSLPSTKSVAEALGRLIRHNAEGISIAHFYEIRRMLEPPSAQMAALRHEPADLEVIIAALQRMEHNRNDSTAWTNADLDFHLAIAAATHNPLVRSILDPLTASLRKVIAAGHVDPSGIRAGLEAHRRILEAIRRHDGEDAYQSMMNHLTDSEQRLSKLGFNLDT